jgi:Zn-dependent M28 family amino/carboxypeptidase
VKPSQEQDTASRLQAHVKMLAGTIGERNVFRPEALAAARDYIETTWRAQGYRVDAQEFEANGVTCANLEATRPGAGRAEEILLLGAHYDSVRDCPGANDNGSGVAALLELGRRFAELTPALTVRLVAFVNEEPPFFMTRHQGSAVYAKAARARNEDITLMVSLETLGYYSDAPGSQRYPPLFRFFYPDRGNFLGLVSDLRSRGVMRRVAKTFRARSDFPLEHTATWRWVPGVAWSDHLPFWRQGYRALMATDTAFYRYRYYHTAQDTPDKLTYPAFGRAIEALGACFQELADQGLA